MDTNNEPVKGTEEVKSEQANKIAELLRSKLATTTKYVGEKEITRTRDSITFEEYKDASEIEIIDGNVIKVMPGVYGTKCPHCKLARYRRFPTSPDARIMQILNRDGVVAIRGIGDNGTHHAIKMGLEALQILIASGAKVTHEIKISDEVQKNTTTISEMDKESRTRVNYDFGIDFILKL
jgi:hypothetical protein